jgi:Tol biopolymer transport system component
MKPTEESDLLQDAVMLAQDGHLKEARLILEKIVEANPQTEMAWLWLVETVDKPALRLSILRECLRHNPGSQFARDGIALIASENPRSEESRLAQAILADQREMPAAPVSEPPDGGAKKIRAPRSASRKSSPLPMVGCLMLLLVLIGGGSVLGGLVVLPMMNGRPPAIALPAFVTNFLPPIRNTATSAFTSTSAPSGTEPSIATSSPAPSLTRSITASGTPTPTVQSTPSMTPTVTPTATPSKIPFPTPTLFAGAGLPNSYELRYMAAGGCTAMMVPIAGGAPKPITNPAPTDCAAGLLSGDGARIAYLPQPGQNTLQVLNVDGSGAHAVVRLNPFEGLPLALWGFQWSPGGTQFAYISSSFGYATGHKPFVEESAAGWLYTVPSDGSAAAKQVDALRVERRFAGGMRWSPDGYWLLVLDHRDAADGAGYYPYAYRAADSAYFMIANMDFQPDANARFDWSPDSRYISHLLGRKPTEYDCVAKDAPDDQTYLILAGLSGVQGLPHEPTRQCIRLAQSRTWSLAFGALWSPDGKSLLLFDSGSLSLVTIASNGTNTLPILSLDQEPLYAGWSPDSKWIYFIEPGWPADAGGILEVVHADGTDRRALAYGVATGPVYWK